MSWFWIFLGGGLGSMARFAASGWVARHWGETFPWGTLGVNVVGSFLIGCFATLTAPEGRWLVGQGAREWVMIGLCGGFTTFSSFSLQTLNLAREGEWFKAAANVLLSVGMCLLAVWLGHVLAVLLNSARGN